MEMEDLKMSNSEIIKELMDEYDLQTPEQKKESEKLVSEEMLPFVLHFFSKMVHKNNVDHGFWEDGYETRNKSEMLMLMVTELAEACEGLRHGNPPDDHLPQYPTAGVELADCVIRILDYCAAFDIPIGEIIAAKHDYNTKRPYKHGKQF